MDAVVLFINGDAPSVKARLKSSGVALERFYNWGFLRYCLRSIDCYAKFIERVFLVVGNDDEVPSYVNREVVKIIHENEFIPSQYKVVCNSNTVELNLYRISDLSERFIEFNDDMFLSAPSTEEDWFTGGIPRTNLYIVPMVNSDYRRTILNSNNWAASMAGVTRKNGDSWHFINDHGPHVLTKDLLKRVWLHDYYKLDMIMTPTRSPKNITVDTVSFYLKYIGLLKGRPLKNSLCSVNTPLETLREAFNTSASVVINDVTNCDRGLRKREITSFLNSVFPKKSRFEN